MKTDIININGDHYKIIISKQMIADTIEELAASIKMDYAKREQPPILLIVLTGGLYFGIDLSKKLDRIGLRHHIDTVGLKRYGGDEKGGAVDLLSRPHADLGGRDVIVIEDVVDNGATMNFLDDFLSNLKNPPKSIQYCVLGLKTHHGPLRFDIKYLGFDSISPAWIVGYGLDANQSFRGLEDIYQKIKKS